MKPAAWQVKSRLWWWVVCFVIGLNLIEETARKKKKEEGWLASSCFFVPPPCPFDQIDVRKYTAPGFLFPPLQSEQFGHSPSFPNKKRQYVLCLIVAFWLLYFFLCVWDSD